ncbi:hypothetical protein POTOM_018578 [Populus tomentosa]|uniref:Uncharacterized protein n=1 Tax=Populus tomentosa TaxID=118781 RepID=A0A8X8D2D6_POPTO|nr:hypothetical protein POTOM_018578 [Populus tomentosa]
MLIPMRNARESVLMSLIVKIKSNNTFFFHQFGKVVTCQYEGDETKRQEALRLAMQLRANSIDVELEIVHEFNDSMDGKKPDKFKVIVSSHNFHNTPTANAIADLVTRIQATGADIVKISTTALDIKDYGKHFSGYGTFSTASSAATSLMEHLRPVLYQLLDNLLRRIWGGASCRPYLELCDVSHVVGDVEPRPIIHVLGDVDPGPSFCSML